MFFPRIFSTLPLLARLLIGMTVHSGCDEIFEDLLQRYASKEWVAVESEKNIFFVNTLCMDYCKIQWVPLPRRDHLASTTSRFTICSLPQELLWPSAPESESQSCLLRIKNYIRLKRDYKCHLFYKILLYAFLVSIIYWIFSSNKCANKSMEVYLPAL